MLIKYPKIESVYKRDENFKIVPEYKNNYFEFLKDVHWIAYEKIDGTNLRLYWDGYKLSIHGRTDNAKFNNDQQIYLNNRFLNKEFEDMVEQIFKDKEVIIFGEFVGKDIQAKVENYDFFVFDIAVISNNDYIWLERNSIIDIADTLKLKYVPFVMIGTLPEIIDWVKQERTSLVSNHRMEGVVAQPRMPLLQRNKERIITKIKYDDLKELKDTEQPKTQKVACEDSYYNYLKNTEKIN